MGAPPHGYDPRVAEQQVLRALTAAAEIGAPCPTQDDLADLIGVNSVSTTVGIVNRLAAKGLIAVQRYQRERRVTIVKTGKSTAPVKNAAPHWRSRPDVPAPAITLMRARDVDASRLLMLAARREGRTLQDFLADMVWLGFAEYQRSAS